MKNFWKFEGKNGNFLKIWGKKWNFWNELVSKLDLIFIRKSGLVTSNIWSLLWRRSTNDVELPRIHKETILVRVIFEVCCGDAVTNDVELPRIHKETIDMIQEIVRSKMPP